MEEFNNKVIILKDEIKDSFLSRINSLINIKVITLSELKKSFYFDYDKEALYYICKKYDVIYDVAKKYINGIYYVNDKEESKKIKFLSELKNDLDNNSLLKYNDLFINFISGKNVVLYNLEYIDKFYNNIFNELDSVCNIEYYNDEYNFSKKKIYKASNKKEEISFVAYKICELIDNGVDINNIKLINVNDDYLYDIKKIFKMFNIPFVNDSDESIIGTNIIQKFISNYDSDINNSLDSIRDLINTEEDEYIYNKLVNVLNSYYFIDDFNDVKSFVIDDLSNIKIKNKDIKNAVRVCRLEEVNKNDYAFLINFNEGFYPKKYKDEDYLSDKEKNVLGISDSKELNVLNSNEIKRYIGGLNNLIVSYSEYGLKGKIYISSLFDKELFDEEELYYEYKYSNDFNKIELLKLNDEYNKYGTESDIYHILLNYYGYEYKVYDNKYKLIDNNILKDCLNNSLVLSYSSINTYYECSFKYYLTYILSLNKYDRTFDTIVGNIYHSILSECFDGEYDIKENYDKEVLKYSDKFDFSEADKFFLDILKDELVLIVDIIKNQLNYTLLKKSMYEKEIIIDIDKNNNVKFKGFVDKILYDEFGSECICMVVDYKTGNTKLDLNNTYYGLNMQLPVYIYLIKNSNIISNVRIGGFYIQKIINDGSEDEKKNLLKLQGYTNSDIDVINKVDSSYEDSNMIYGLKTTNSGGFYAYSKLINDDEINYLNNIIDSRIREASDDILNAKFDINPKSINNNNMGCTYCKYKDICYMKNDDIVPLKKIDNIFEMEGN